MVDRREILAEVAAGRLTPAAALQLLEDPVTGPEPSAGLPAAGIRRVRIECDLGRLMVIGDSTVREAAAEGDHEARLEGDTLVIEGERAGRGFTFGRHSLGWGIGPRDIEMVVRVNPDLPIELEVTAGKASVRGVRAAIKAEVAAGTLDVDGFRSTVDLTVTTGTVSARGRLDQGRSTIRCELGKVNLELDPQSSVRITARTELGKVSLPGERPRRPGVTVDGERSTTVGGGTASLDIETTAGRVDVRV